MSRAQLPRNTVDSTWIVQPPVAAAVELALAAELRLHPVAARVLCARGITEPDAALRFLDVRLEALPDPFLMRGMEAAVQRLVLAVQRKERVTIWGDYDVDGVSSTALVAGFLGELGIEVRPYIPHRLREGYGLNVQALARLAEEGTKLLVTLDCGVTAVEEVRQANALGLEVIIVDHHAVPEVLPEALAIINPLQPGCEYPSKSLCAAGVAFNLCLALRKRLRELGHFQGAPEPNLKLALDLVALATVADVVPLTGANRILVHHGLRVMENTSRKGLKALKAVASLQGPITAGMVGFRLGPRINAAGRLDDAMLGLRCLLAQTDEEAERCANALDKANRDRQDVEQIVLTEALALGAEAVARGAKGFVLSAPHWHPGVVGIVASRIVERFHRPTVLIGVHEGVGKGSGRAIEGFHLLEAVRATGEKLQRFGGHRAAVGVTIAPADIPDFAARFEAFAAERLTDAELRPKVRVDAAIALADLDLELCEGLQALGPFGMGNPEPTLMLCGAHVQGKVFGRAKAKETPHLRLSFPAAPQIQAVAWGMEAQLPLIENAVDCAFRVGLDEFRGQRRLSLNIRALRAADIVAASG